VNESDNPSNVLRRSASLLKFRFCSFLLPGYCGGDGGGDGSGGGGAHKRVSLMLVTSKHIFVARRQTTAEFLPGLRHYVYLKRFPSRTEKRRAGVRRNAPFVCRYIKVVRGKCNKNPLSFDKRDKLGARGNATFCQQIH
jgi:hypothetical protein